MFPKQENSIEKPKGQPLPEERVELEKPEKKGLNRKEQAELLKAALKEHEVELDQLHGKKLALNNTKGEFEKRLDGFEESEKLMAKALEPFNGMQDGHDKREMLFLALDEDLNPERSDKLKADQNERHELKLTAEQKEKIFEELDSRLADAREDKGGKPETKPSDHLAAYVFLKEEKIFAAEDQLNGTREQDLAKDKSFLSARGAVYDSFRDKPDFLISLNGVVNNKSTTTEEKNRALNGLSASVSDPEQRKALDGYLLVLQERDSGDFKHAIELSEGTVRREKESLSRINEWSEQEKAVAQLTDVDAPAKQQKKSLVRHDVNENSGQASA